MTHISPLVPHLVAVIGSAKHRRAKPFVLNGVSTLAHFVTTQDTRYSIELAPPASYIRSKADSDTL